MRNEFKLLNYQDIREDDRELTVISNSSGKIVLWNPHIREWWGDETEEEIEILEQADGDLTCNNPCGTGRTIDEALADYVNKLNKKTLCFESEYDKSLYLVTFDFDDPEEYMEEDTWCKIIQQ